LDKLIIIVLIIYLVPKYSLILLLKRNVDINDIGGSAIYLLSDLSAAVTGEIHYVDAGYNKVGMPNPKNMT